MLPIAFSTLLVLQLHAVLWMNLKNLFSEAAVGRRVTATAWDPRGPSPHPRILKGQLHSAVRLLAVTHIVVMAWKRPSAHGKERSERSVSLQSFQAATFLLY